MNESVFLGLTIFGSFLLVLIPKMLMEQVDVTKSEELGWTIALSVILGLIFNSAVTYCLGFYILGGTFAGKWDTSTLNEISQSAFINATTSAYYGFITTLTTTFLVIAVPRMEIGSRLLNAKFFLKGLLKRKSPEQQPINFLGGIRKSITEQD